MRGFPALRAVLVLVGALLCAPSLAAAQDPAGPLARPLRVFIDCRGGGCDLEFFRKELHWIDHVRDPNDADLHLLITTQDTGGGGTEYTIRLIGRGRWSGRDDVVRISSEAGEPDDGLRRALLRVFSLVLARYAVETPVGSKLSLQAPAADPSAASQTTAAGDRWNFWVYRISFNSNVSGQRGDKNSRINVNGSADRLTNAWKIQINGGFNYSENRFELSDGTFQSYVKGRHFNSLVVKSLNDHWSAGGLFRASRSSFNNQRLNLRAAPGIEYNVFPYSQSTQRQFTIQWTAGVNRFKYDTETIYGVLQETRWDQQFLTFLSLRQPFGTVRVTAEAAHFLDNADQNRFSVFGDTEVRLFRGFSFNVFGDYSVLHDQLYLPRAGASDEEILARQRQLETTYRYFVAVGITYRFGSINNNIVNPRFGGGF
jgi:hypothetical protein